MNTSSAAHQSPPSDVWVDERVEVRSSTIDGRGWFARAPIGTGEVVVRFGGRLVASSELDALLATTEVYVDTITVFDGVHLVLPPATAAHFGNHSCDPNVWHVGPYELATRRPLAVGDELTVDYATHSGADGLDLACTCGTATCRGRVTSDDWRRRDLQARYAGHWTPALQSRIDRQ